MGKKGNTKNERIEELEEAVDFLDESFSDMETKMEKMEKMQNETCNTQQSRIDKLINLIAYVTTVIIVLVLAFAIPYAINVNQKIDALQEEVQTLQLQYVSTQPNAAEEFINAVFPMEDRTLYDRNGNTFYRDPDCKYAITNPEFCSYRCKSGENSLGNNIDIYRLTDGNFAYIPSNFSVNLWPK